MAIVYNIVFNHLSAWLIKPGSPNDLKVNINYYSQNLNYNVFSFFQFIEQLRKDLKQRESRKELKTVEKKGKESYVEDDRFEGVSKDVKKLLKYRVKTINNLEQSW